MGGLVGNHSEGQCSCELLAHFGRCAAHAGRPRDGGGVVTPSCSVAVLEVNQLLQNKVVQQQAGHFQVIDREQALVEQLDDFWGPLEAPDNWTESSATGHPHTPSSKLAGVAVSDVGWHSWHQLAALGGTFAHDQKHGAEVAKGMLLLAFWVDLSGGFVGILGAVEGSVEGRQESSPPRDSKAGVLALANERLKLFELTVALAKGGCDGLSDGFDFSGRQFHRAVQAIKDPSQDFLASFPDAFSPQHQLFLGDWGLASVACG